MTRTYVGLACTYHDPAIAVVDEDGEVIFAEATERRLQWKRAINHPPDDAHIVDDVLAQHCPAGVEVVAARSWSEEAKDNVERALAAAAPVLAKETNADARIPLARFIAGLLGEWEFNAQQNAMNQCGLNLRLRLRESDPGYEAPVTWRAYDHHLSHAAAACHASSWDEALCAVLDGYGEGTAYAFYRYQDGELTLLPSKRGLGSLGQLYYLLCYLCGFDPIEGEEWKVMGLAAYGKLDPKAYPLLRDLYRVNGLDLELGPGFGTGVESLLERRRPLDVPALEYADLAYTGQAVFGELASELLCNLHAAGGSDRLVLTGGCALNSSYNGEVLASTPFRELFVPSAPADDGNAVGAAFLAWAEDHPGGRPRWKGPYLGSCARPDVIERVIGLGGLVPTRREDPAVLERTAELLAAGRIVGWMQGRAEFGPRALGNRSILADPRDPSVKERLNAEVKFREEFRPFAPSILHEHGPAYFEDYQESRYMERTLKFRSDVVQKVPGVVHVDGTGRLQSVRRESNPRYHDLIAAFSRRTGVPILLNTSFNVMGKPIVHSVEDALAVFHTSGLDALVVDDVLFEKG